MSEWKPISSAPKIVSDQAKFYAPRVGDLIYQCYPDGEGNTCVVKFPGPEFKPTLYFVLPPTDTHG